MKPFTKKLVLENGREFLGYGYGANVERVCDIVFNTSVVGYQEILSDPSCTITVVCSVQGAWPYSSPWTSSHLKLRWE